MTTALIIGAARTVVLGPAYDTESPARGTTVAHDAAGIKVELQVGDAAPVDITSNLSDTPGDWYWRAVGSMGDHALDIPASYFVEANTGKAIRLNAHADDVQPFGNRESYIVVDPGYVDENNQAIAELAVSGYGWELDQNVIPNVINIKRLSDDATVASLPVTTGSRNPFISLGSS